MGLAKVSQKLPRVPGCYQSAKKWATESPCPQSRAESGI